MKKPTMGKLIVTIVPPSPNREAEEQFRQWVANHAELIATLDDEAMTVLHIRGSDDDDLVDSIHELASDRWMRASAVPRAGGSGDERCIPGE